VEPIASDRIVQAFVDLTEVLVGSYDAAEFVQQLVGQAVDLIDVADAGVLLAEPDGQLHVVASSSGLMRVVELLEVHIDEGPCYDAHVEDETVVAHDLASSVDRWPRFAPPALDLGFVSVYALPLRGTAGTIGALNLFGRRTHAVGDEGLRVARGLADFASLGIRLTDQVGHHDELVRQLRDALESRIVIEQAKGVIATQAGIDVAEAFERLRNEARNSGRLLADVAAAVVDGSLAATDLGEPPLTVG
jgi:hypothetical protein